MTTLLVILLVLLALLGMPLFVVLAGGSLLATFTAGIDPVVLIIELDRLASWGVTGLWLIGLWERSPASARIKQAMGNPDWAMKPEVGFQEPKVL